MKATIVEYHGGFCITVYHNGKEETWSFSQEESVQELVHVFEHMGIDAEYEEAY